MKTLHPLPRSRRGFTLIELMVVVTIIAIIAGMAFPAYQAFIMRAKMNKMAGDGRSIYQAMANYAIDPEKDEFPTYADVDDPNTAVTTSNEAFEILLKKNLVDDKRIFANPASAWHTKQPNNETTAKRVQTGESDWVYVAGLRWSTRDSKWPVLANAFSPGTTTYVTNPSQKGGVWKGTKAVVIWAGGNAEVVDTKEQGSSYFIKRADKPSANAFEKEGEWLSGERVKVLYPAG